jgi:cellulose synthase/poly-beta-1,6-N-acetylglucosamine synthase-like glycosyltransferase
VGGVAGHLHMISERSDAGGHGEKLYWSYEKWLKQMESRTGSVISANGSIYAIRRKLYRPVLDFAVTDDFAISTGVIEQHKRLVFEPEAVAYEETAPVTEKEFRRRVRLMTRGLRAVALRKTLLNPFRFGFYSVVFFTHKILRRLTAFFLLLLFAASVALSYSSPFYLAACIGQVCFYGLALAGYQLRNSAWSRAKIFLIPFFYCMSNIAAFIAVINFVRGRRIELWQPQRPNET